MPKRLAREELQLLERSLEHLHTTPQRGCVEAGFPIVERVQRLDPRPGQLLDPANVCRRDEVPGRPHHMRPENRALAERALDRAIVGVARTQPDSPFRAGVVLRLHRAEPADHVGGRAAGAAAQPLTAQSPGDRIDLQALDATLRCCRLRAPIADALARSSFVRRRRNLIDIPGGGYSDAFNRCSPGTR